MTREEYDKITEKIIDYGYQMLEYGLNYENKEEKEKAEKIREEITDILIKYID